MWAQQIMSSPVVTVEFDVPLKKAFNTMQEHCIRHLPVVNSQGALVGVLSDRDLREIIMLFDQNSEDEEDYWVPGGIAVGQVIARDPVTISPGANVREAVRVMKEGRLRCIPVLSTGRLVGIVTSTDLLDALSSLLKVETPKRFP